MPVKKNLKTQSRQAFDPVTRKNKSNRALLRINMAQSLDGHTIAPDGRWAFGTKEDKRRMDHLRLWADCIIASRRSLENDNPNLFARTKPEAPQPVPVVILRDSARKISANLRIFEHPHPAGEFWVSGSQGLKIEEIVEGIELCDAKKQNRIKQWNVFSFEKMQDIYNSLVQRKYRKILLEGGPSLNGLFLEENLIDEIFFTIVPYLWAGQTTDRIITSRENIPINKFKLLNVERRKDEVFFRYKRIKHSPPHAHAHPLSRV